MSSAVKIANYQRPVDLLEISRKDGLSQTSKTKSESFGQVLNAEMSSSAPVHVSKHASQRLYSRGIEMNESRMNDIAAALDKAGARGSKETLILADDMALVASVDSRTIITAFDKQNLREGVITSIDSAVIL